VIPLSDKNYILNLTTPYKEISKFSVQVTKTLIYFKFNWELTRMFPWPIAYLLLKQATATENCSFKPSPHSLLSDVIVHPLKTSFNGILSALSLNLGYPDSLVSLGPLRPMPGKYLKIRPKLVLSHFPFPYSPSSNDSMLYTQKPQEALNLLQRNATELSSTCH
jgi:hypothetical protein